MLVDKNVDSLQWGNAERSTEVSSNQVNTSPIIPLFFIDWFQHTNNLPGLRAKNQPRIWVRRRESLNDVPVCCFKIRFSSANSKIKSQI